MSSTSACYDDILRHQRVLRAANRRILEEICPKSLHDNLYALLAKGETDVSLLSTKEIRVVHNVDKITQAKNHVEKATDDEEDDGYKSGPLDVPEEKAPSNKIKPHFTSSQTNLPLDKTSSENKSSHQRRRPASASATIHRTNVTSTFHQKCKPIEPDRRFIAIPFPSNLYQSDALKISSKIYVYSINR